MTGKEDDQDKQWVVNSIVGVFEEHSASKNKRMEGGIKGGKDVIRLPLILLATQFEVFLPSFSLPAWRVRQVLCVLYSNKRVSELIYKHSD